MVQSCHTLILVDLLLKQSYKAFFLVNGSLVLVFVLNRVATRSIKSEKTEKNDISHEKMGVFEKNVRLCLFKLKKILTFQSL